MNEQKVNVKSECKSKKNEWEIEEWKVMKNK